MGVLLNTYQKTVSKMKLYIVLAFLATAALATPTTKTCEQKNEVLKNALVNLAKKHPIQSKDDCSECFADILQAVGDCVSFTDPAAIIKCVQDIIGAANPCYECICELITDIGNLFGQDWHC